MTRPASASPAKSADDATKSANLTTSTHLKTAAKPPAETPADAALRAKRQFVVAAHAASPLRAVEKYPWTAVTTAAAATMAATVVVSMPAFGKGTSKIGGTLISTALALGGSMLRAKFMPPGVKLDATVKPTPTPSESSAKVTT